MNGSRDNRKERGGREKEEERERKGGATKAER